MWRTAHGVGKAAVVYLINDIKNEILVGQYDSFNVTFTPELSPLELHLLPDTTIQPLCMAAVCLFLVSMSSFYFSQSDFIDASVFEPGIRWFFIICLVSINVRFIYKEPTIVLYSAMYGNDEKR